MQLQSVTTSEKANEVENSGQDIQFGSVGRPYVFTGQPARELIRIILLRYLKVTIFLRELTFAMFADCHDWPQNAKSFTLKH